MKTGCLCVLGKSRGIVPRAEGRGKGPSFFISLSEFLRFYPIGFHGTSEKHAPDSDSNSQKGICFPPSRIRTSL